MKTCLSTFFFSLVFSAVVVADGARGDQQAVSPANMATKAELITSPPPIYPKQALRNKIEGWVVVRLVVRPDGATDQIEIIDSSIDKIFDKPAIEAVKQYVYKPATLNGEPVMQANVTVRQWFKLYSSDGGVGKRFMRAYTQAQEAIDANQLDKAQEIIDELEEKDQKLLAEVCYLDMLKAAWYSKAGDQQATIKYIERALVMADKVADKPIYFNLLRQAIVDNARAGRLARSIEHYETLLKADKNLSEDDSIHAYIGKVKAAIDGDKVILTAAVIEKTCQNCKEEQSFWDHTLNRNQFSIDQVAGRIDTLDIICETSIVTLDYEPGKQWGVKREGGSCSLKVIGGVGTTFRLIEMPNS
jgi:TonB family protein